MVLETPIAIDPTGEISKKGTPIYAVRLKTPTGRPFDAGTAFLNEISTGENAGKTCWSIRISKQPGIPHGLALVGWPDGEGWYLSLDDGRAPVKAAAPADDMPNDHIPF